VTFRSSVNPAKAASKGNHSALPGTLRGTTLRYVREGRPEQRAALAIVDDMVAPNSGVLNDSRRWHAS